jgi:hypothetical protein
MVITEYYTLLQLTDKLLSADIDATMVVALNKCHPELKIDPVIIDGEKYWRKDLVETWLKVATSKKPT